MTRTYCKNYCGLCGRITSSNGLAVSSHLKSHVREGYYLADSRGNILSRSDKIFNKEKYQSENKGPSDNPFQYYQKSC